MFKFRVVLPASSATAERSFRTLRRLKNYLRLTRPMTQERLNHVAVHHVHKTRVDALDINKIKQLLKLPRPQLTTYQLTKCSMSLLTFSQLHILYSMSVQVMLMLLLDLLCILYFFSYIQGGTEKCGPFHFVAYVYATHILTISII